ncbi:MAG: hypothetical protein IPM98_17190 [Lewinellaceae bacterium]|nr:hypothetical protein [Lewinellaceae bacterium]
MKNVWPNACPDADMLQIGKLSKRGPVGPERFSLLTNDEVIAVNQRGYAARQLFRRDSVCVWVSQNPDSPDLNVAFFNLSENEKEVPVSLAELGLTNGAYIARDLWAKRASANFSNTFSPKVKPHGARLFRIQPKH